MEQTVFEIAPSTLSNQIKEQNTEKTPNVTDAGDESSAKNILQLGNGTEQIVLETILPHANQIKKTKKRKKSKKRKNSISNPCDESSGKDILPVGDETEQSVPETTLSHENQTKKSKKRKKPKWRKNSTLNPGDASSTSSKNVAKVGNETEQAVKEMMFTHENRGKKSKRKFSISNADSNGGDSSLLCACVQSIHLDGEEADCEVKGSCNEDKTCGASSFLDQSNVSSEQRNAILPALAVKAAGRARRKLLVLDLNGLLADIVSCPEKGYEPDTWVGRKAVFKRPFCDDFLQFCFETFDVGVWTSRSRKNAKSVVDFLMGDRKKRLLFCWDQDDCTITGCRTTENKDKPLFLKEIKKLWDRKRSLPWKRGDYNEFNTLLIDDSPYKAICNPPYTGIFPNPHVYKDVKDNSLGPNGELRLYLKRLAAAKNVPRFVKNNPIGQQPITSSSPSWVFYSEVLDAIGSSKTRIVPIGSSKTRSGRRFK